MYPRPWVKFTFIAFILVLGACSNPGHSPLIPTQIVFTTTPVPTATQPPPSPMPPTATPEACPADPEDWTLTDNQRVLGSNLKGLSPQCVYDQLEKTVAWVYATTVLGHTRSEASNLLDISGIPMAYLPKNQLTVLTDYKDTPQKVEVRDFNNHPNLSEWRIDTNGNPGAEVTFSGCFWTSSADGEQVVSWGDGYPIVCQFFFDYQYIFLVNEVKGKILTIDAPRNVRRPAWFGYVSNGNWVWLGSAIVWDVELSKIKVRETPILDPTIVMEKYGIDFVPLPQDWESAVGQEFEDEFLAALNSREP